MRIQFNGDQTLVRLDGVKQSVKGGEVFECEDEYGAELLRYGGNLFIIAPEEVKKVKATAKIVKPKAMKTTAQVSNYSKE